MQSMKWLKINIRSARLRAGMSQSELARALKVSRSAVNHWESLSVPNLPTVDRLYDVARELGMGVGELLAQKGESPLGARTIPVISWPMLQAISDEGELTNIPENTPRTLCPVRHSAKSFALIMEGDSMTSDRGVSFPRGTTIYCDPQLRNSVEPGRHVLARVEATQRIVFKEMASDHGHLYLRSLNPRAPSVHTPFTIVSLIIGLSYDLADTPYEPQLSTGTAP